MKSLVIILLAVVASAVLGSPHGYIVELDALDLAKRSSSGSSTTAEFYNQLKADNVVAVPRHNFSSPVFEGLSFQLTSDVPAQFNSALNYFGSLPFVKSVWPIDTVYHANKDSDTENNPEPKKLNLHKRASHVRRSNSSNPAASVPWTAIHDFTNVNQVQARGIKGAGVVIAVLDTGIDYTHPTLGGGLGPSFKVKGGYDFVGNGATYAGGFHPNPDPMDVEGHGTQAGGVAAGKSSQYLGVAPDASILAYRVFESLKTYTTVDVILAAMQRAYQDGADVISMSLGTSTGFVSHPISVLADKLVAQGIICSVSSGNSGVYGPYEASIPGKTFLNVGTTESPVLAAWPITAQSSSGNSLNLNYLSTNGSYFPLNGNYLVDYSSSSACGLTARPGNSTILFVPRDNACPDGAQFAAIQGLGYKYAFLINNPSSKFLYNFAQKFPGPLLGGAFIDNSFASWFDTESHAANTITVYFNQENGPVGLKSSFVGAGLPNRISSWGPTYDNYFYPSVTAPGGNVLVPNLGDGFLIVSGTSFAAPYVAGVAALYLSSRGISRAQGNSYAGVAEDFNQKVISSARVLDLFDGTNHVTGVGAPLNQQGAGLIDALKVVDYSTSLESEPLISLNDTMFRDPFKKIKIKNNSKKWLYYTAKHVAGTTVTVLNSAGVPNPYFPPYNTQSSAFVTMVPSAWLLLPGASATIYLYIGLPQKTSESIVYQGKIQISISNGEVISVPYMGIQQVTKQVLPISGPSSPILRFGPQGPTPQNSPIPPFHPSQGDFPFTSVNLSFGSAEVSVDVVSSAYNLQTDFTPDPVKGQRNFAGFAGAADPNNGPLTFPQTYLARQPNMMMTFPITNFADGSPVPPGKYRVLTRALVPFGNRNKAGDWQKILSDEITIA